MVCAVGVSGRREAALGDRREREASASVVGENKPSEDGILLLHDKTLRAKTAVDLRRFVRSDGVVASDLASGSVEGKTNATLAAEDNDVYKTKTFQSMQQRRTQQKLSTFETPSTLPTFATAAPSHRLLATTRPSFGERVVERVPSTLPTFGTDAPTVSPTFGTPSPSSHPTFEAPSASPTFGTASPSPYPTFGTDAPTASPTFGTASPTSYPTFSSNEPTVVPTRAEEASCPPGLATKVNSFAGLAISLDMNGDGGSLLLTSDILVQSRIDIVSSYAICSLEHKPRCLDGQDSSQIFTVSEGSTLVLANVILKRGYSEEEGGAIVVFDDARVHLWRCLLTENTAEDGGAVYVIKGSLLASETTFANNTAVSDGGAINVMGGSAVLAKCSVEGNVAYNGGGFYARRSFVSLQQQSQIVANTAVRYGGGGYGRRSSTLVATSSVFEANAVLFRGQGGGLRLSSHSLAAFMNAAFLRNDNGALHLQEDSRVVALATEFAANDLAPYVDSTSYFVDVAGPVVRGVASDAFGCGRTFFIGTDIKRNNDPGFDTRRAYVLENVNSIIQKHAIVGQGGLSNVTVTASQINLPDNGYTFDSTFGGVLLPSSFVLDDDSGAPFILLLELHLSS